ncbi:conjugal transfer protein TraN [Vreelandella massiliensis]|uniref:conjugal transfer protein TraN n=1 Tax=Vreelandella massiliensis TaxID=1816686 RepID=UPI00096A40D1|nr:conjugal transfer protein TraN [Halomonas massiliensis]
MKPPLRKVIAVGLSLVMAFQPFAVAAQNVPDAPDIDDDASLSFEESSRYGQDLGGWAKDFQSDSEEMSPDDFFTDEGDNANFEGAFPDPDELENASDSENAVANMGSNLAAEHRANADQARQEREACEANGEENCDAIQPDANAASFVTAEAQAKRQAPDMSDDPVFNSADDLLNAIENPDQAAALCQDDSAASTQEVVCDQGASRGNSCEASHTYSAGLIEHLEGAHNLSSCGEGCMDIWLGTVGNNYRSGGSCTVFTEDISLRVLYPEAITSATIVDAKYDDHLRIYLDSLDIQQGEVSTGVFNDNYQREENLVWQSPFGWSDAWAHGAGCERSTSHDIAPNTDVTSEMKKDVLNFRMVNAVGDKGEAYAKIRIHYDPSKVIDSEGWTSDLCAEQAQNPDMSVECTRMPELNGNGCTVVGSVEVCGHHFDNDAQFPGVSALCESVSVSGASSAPQTAGAPSCDTALEGRECSLISTECVLGDGSTSEEEACEVERHTYECGGGQGGFQCDLPDILPEAFADCEPEYVVCGPDDDREVCQGHTPDGGDMDYTISDVRTCHEVKALDTCDLERKVEIKEATGSQSWSEGCFDNRTYTFTAPNAATTIEGYSSLTNKKEKYASVSIADHPSDANDWTTTITASGSRQTYPDSAAAQYTHSTFHCPSGYSSSGSGCEKTEEDEDGNTVTLTASKVEKKHYTCSHLPNDVPGYGGYVVNGWSLSGTTCSRTYSTCNTASAPELSFTLEYEGLYMAQEFEHFPSDDGISECIIESDDFTSTQWECQDDASRSIDSPWGPKNITAIDLEKLDYMYPDDPYQSPHTETVASSDQKGSSCWYGHAEYNADTDGNAEMWLGESDSYEDIYGNEQQYDNEDIESAELEYDTCDDLNNDPQCQFVETRCVGGAEGHEDFCYVESHIYECGDVGTVENSTVKEVYNCEGMLNCAGEECVDINQESSSSADFAEAASMLQAVEQMATDMECTGTDENGIPTGVDNVECHVFKGDEYQCRRPIGSSVHGHDCCEQPADINLGDYLTAVTQMPRLDAAIMGMEGTNAASGAIKGSYTSLRDPVMNTFEAVKKPVINAAEGITGSVEPVTKPVTEFYDDAISYVKDGVSKLAGDIGFTSGGSATAGGSAGAGAGMGAEGAKQTFSEQMLGATGAQALSILTTAYTLYSMTMLAIQIIWECTEDDFKLAAQRDMKTCVYVGSYCSTETVGGLCITERESYCCYSSPLARIINEQAQ